MFTFLDCVGELGQYHGCCCPGSLHHLAISIHGIDYARQTTGSKTCAISVLRNNKRPVGLSSFVNCPPVVASFLTQRQLRINAGWQHMGRVPHPNYVDPEYCVATVCHQVRFMYWEHLGHFQRAISHLKGHKIVCMRYLACAFSQMKSTDMFSMYLQSGVPRHFIWWFIAGWT